jgi:hypothetical protein
MKRAMHHLSFYYYWHKAITNCIAEDPKKGCHLQTVLYQDMVFD